MARSVLPPIVWDASCGHRNEVRSDWGGFAVGCKACGARMWCPKRKPPRTVREPPGRVNMQELVGWGWKCDPSNPLAGRH